jgi:hypothetical protein
MKYNVHNFNPNPGYLSYKLTQDEIDFLWKRIDKANKKHEVINGQLAGNISKSLNMGLYDIDPILNLAKKYNLSFICFINTPYFCLLCEFSKHDPTL